MTTRYYAEEPCVHERTDECGDRVCRECNGPYGHRPGCSFEARGSQGTYPCPGGTRRELDGEIVSWMNDDWGIPVVGYFKNRAWFDDDEKRFLVVPLSGDPQ